MPDSIDNDECKDRAVSLCVFLEGVIKRAPLSTAGPRSLPPPSPLQHYAWLQEGDRRSKRKRRKL